ncbi:MAG: Neutral/alkaline non-lysosomal ceramidase, N-terminal [Firmicutes bacterium]|nr:Neutral/alkaline non-lysosomal ceramidase, N-terminal [Bacillota bacterium]
MRGLLSILTVFLVVLIGVSSVPVCDANIKSVTPMTNENNCLNIGSARVKINIPDNFFPYTSFRGRYYTGIHDELYVRAIMIANKTDTALFISIDNGDISDEWLSKISSSYIGRSGRLDFPVY